MSKSPLVLNVGESVVRGSAPTLEGVYKRAGFVLTSERVIQVVKSGLGSRSLHSIGLDKIDSVYAKTKSNLGWIIGALALIVVGMYMWTTGKLQPPETPQLGVFISLGGFVSLIIAVVTRKKTIEIVSGSARMILDLTKVGVRDANALVAEIEQAKVRREVSLRGGDHAIVEQKTGQASAEERLAQLSGLLSKGLISQSEYDTKRQELLSAL